MKKNRLYKLLYVLPLILLTPSCGNIISSDDEDKKSRSGKTIIETGELAAVNSRAFVLPRFGRYWYEMRIIGLLEHGSIVNAGDSIIQLDANEIKRFIIERETNHETELATLEKLYVDQENKIQEAESKIKNEIATFNLKKIELESSRFESERLRKIKELELKQAEITLAKEKRKMELSKIINSNDLKIQEIRVQQIETEIKDAYNILPNLTIRTPISGVFQVEWNRRSGSLVKIGDNIYQGNNMGNVPELKFMKVNTSINETDFLKIRTGQKVAIRLDAMPKLVFDGEVAYIGKLCHLKDYKSKQKVFDVEVKIIKPDERLKPGMTVSCEFLEDN
ncbi:HlyD family efflux transporter periplasmic adaptor subunit [Dysgonomonas sp. 216]|uniref:HlyD family secretion protein n=1 Tax=Dysgonomonas sp. 216 TaxID=2302934 RepID=UPI0013CFB751|nr:efflux RND transporter periplasmic adaptor subunit [Dysgonomonas sp. 216]NDW18797.1 HlyD family efflux transporter periplasmic adaptor subunit [Dysgonomonas sp. 216]